jgi:chitin synthase
VFCAHIELMINVLLIATSSELLSIAEDTILACLRERYLADKPYTAIGSSALVSLNPFKHLEINDDTTLQLYAQEYRHVGDDDSSLGHENDRHERRLPPHVFGLANNAYYHMKRTGQDQSIVIK